jgi:hypothetical protein
MDIEKNLIINSIYPGYLDMTYIPVITKKLKENGLKVAIVFNYTLFQFEIWLSSINRKRRREVIKIISNKQWKNCKISSSNEDAIIEVIIDEIKDYKGLEKIVELLKEKTILFIADIEEFLTEK